MHLELTKNCYASGEIIQGSIHLNIVGSKFPAKVVYLEIIGKEVAKWTSNEGSGSKKHKSKNEGKAYLL